MALEFCFNGSIQIGGKEYQKWSDLRSYLGKIIAKQSVSQSTVGRGSGTSSKASDDKKTPREAQVEANEIAATLANALNKEKGGAVAKVPRSLGSHQSMPVVEDDLAQWVSLHGEAITTFIKSNPLEKKARLHPAFQTMVGKVDELSAQFKNGQKGEEKGTITYQDIFTIIGDALPFPVDWTDFSAETVEFTTQQGGFPADIVGEIFATKDAAHSFGSLRSQYAIGALSEMFGEDGVLDEFPIAKNIGKFLGLFKPATSEKAVKLFNAVAEWDMTNKPRSVIGWTREWADRFEKMVPNKGELTDADISYSMVFSSLQPAGFKGRVVDGEMPGQAGRPFQNQGW